MKSLLFTFLLLLAFFINEKKVSALNDYEIIKICKKAEKKKKLHCKFERKKY